MEKELIEYNYLFLNSMLTKYNKRRINKIVNKMNDE